MLVPLYLVAGLNNTAAVALSNRWEICPMWLQNNPERRWCLLGMHCTETSNVHLCSCACIPILP